MSQQLLAQLAEDYNDYFSIQHSVAINARVLGDGSVLPDQEQFLNAIPAPFLLASDISDLNHSSQRPLQRLGELAEELTTYLQHQARKIDLLLHYMLQQQDDASHRYHTVSFGGAGCCYLADAPLQPLQVIEMKIFPEQNYGAVFCYAQVLSCEKQHEQWQIKVVFRRIRDEDRDSLIRASLHLQSRQLKLKAEQRQKQQSD